MTNRPLGAQISHMLRDRGVDVIFGIPGVHNQEMYRGIQEAGLTHILARHEQGAGFMADGYARATGRPGVCYVITGPGVCNVMTPMGQAYSDSVPMLVISSCLDETAAHRGQLHQMKDQQTAAGTVCDWSETARSPQAAYQLIDRALQEFATKRPRSKHIQVPIAQLMAPAGAAPQAKAETAALPVPDGRAVQSVLDHVTAAHRPLFVIGGGCVKAAKDDKIAPALQTTQPAVFVSYAGRGCVSPAYPLFLGSALARPSSDKVFEQADVVVIIGCNMDEVDLWRETASFADDAVVIRVDIDAEVLANDTRANLCVLGDAASVFEALGDTACQTSDWTKVEIQNRKDGWLNEVTAERPGIVEAAQALRAALPNGTMVYSDMTQFAYAAKEVWDMDEPGHWHHPTGFGTLGYALPAAIGGKIGCAATPVIAIAGDYGFQYSVQELIVAVENKLCLPIILWDNGKLGEIEASMIAAQIAPNAVDQMNPDFVALAHAYGAATARPQCLSDIAKAIDTALGHDGPTLIYLSSDIA